MFAVLLQCTVHEAQGAYGMKGASLKIIAACCLIACSLHAFAQQHTIGLDNIISEMKLGAKGKFPYGFKPNTSRQKVKKAMPSKANRAEEDSLFLAYSVSLNRQDSDFCTILFDFPDKRLTAASVGTYLSSWDESNKSFNKVKAHFTNLYGAPEYIEDTYYWKYRKKGRTLEIQLWEASFKDDNGYSIDYLYY